MLRMGKMTDYATVVLASLAQEPAKHRAAAELAERTRLSRPTVSKVLKGLQRAGMVISSRGAHGGYHLARRPDQITAAQILDVFEGPIAITECSGASSQCGDSARTRGRDVASTGRIGCGGPESDRPGIGNSRESLIAPPSMNCVHTWNPLV